VPVGGGGGADDPARRRGAHPEGAVRERGAAVEEQEGRCRHRSGVAAGRLGLGQVGVRVANGTGG
jgi:hypothetical protein